MCLTDGSFTCSLCGEPRTGCSLCGESPIRSSRSAIKDRLRARDGGEADHTLQDRALRAEADAMHRARGLGLA